MSRCHRPRHEAHAGLLGLPGCEFAALVHRASPCSGSCSLTRGTGASIGAGVGAKFGLGVGLGVGAGLGANFGLGVGAKFGLGGGLGLEGVVGVEVFVVSNI